MLSLFWERLSSIGTAFIDNPFIARKVKMSNRIAFLVFFASGYTTIMWAEQTEPRHAFMNLLMTLSMLLLLILNKVGAFQLSRIVGIVVSMLVVTYYCLLGGRVGGSQFLLLIVPVITFGLFDFRSEKKIIFGIVALLCSFLALLEIYGYDNVPPVHLEAQEIKVIYSVHIALAMLFCLIFIYVLASDNEKAEEALTHKNEQLTLLTETLSQAKEELWQNQQSLKNAKERAEKALKVKSQFLSNMSHEMRTPLNSIIGFTDILSHMDLKSQEREYVEYVKKASENMLQLVNDVLDFSKFDSDVYSINKKAVNLPDLVKEVWDITHFIAENKGIRFNYQIDSAIENKVLTDELRLKQVLINLVSNAIKFTHQGTVCIKLELISKGKKYQLVKITVADTGIGIDAKNHDLIFESFQQVQSDHGREFGGTGLGLAIVKRLVNAMEGSIQLKSDVGIGSEFIIQMPFALDKQLESTTDLAEIEVGKPNIEHKNILVIEDNEMNQLLIHKMLSEYKPRLTASADGFDALSRMQNEKFDLILLDLQMPGITGLEVYEKMQNDFLYELNKTTPVIVISADVLSETREKVLSKGIKAFVNKPIKKDQLNMAMATAFGM